MIYSYHSYLRGLKKKSDAEFETLSLASNVLDAIGLAIPVSAGSREHVRRTAPYMGDSPSHASIGTVGRELTFTHAHTRREDNCCGVTRQDETTTRTRTQSAASVHRQPSPPPTSMCNNPYRHGWLPLLGLHNRTLIDNLYGACRLFDYPAFSWARPPPFCLSAFRRRGFSPAF